MIPIWLHYVFNNVCRVRAKGKFTVESQYTKIQTTEIEPGFFKFSTEKGEIYEIVKANKP
ncbi:hypothetical protein ES705_24264 [subsurface metagenome]